MVARAHVSDDAAHKLIKSSEECLKPQTASLLACKLALRENNNDLDSARTYLLTNHENLESDARNYLRSENRLADNCVYADHSGFVTVCMQTVEVTIGSRMLTPVPSEIAQHRVFNTPATISAEEPAGQTLFYESLPYCTTSVA
jgi:hypothetical protein